jgi:UDP-N-acetyl-D-galactosamine dehydrogenase
MTVVAVVGLGYVGLPLAVEFGKKGKTIGYDLSERKIESYKRFIDPTGEVSNEALKAAKNLTVSTDPAELSLADHIIVSVPTPVDVAHNPDFTSLIKASETIGRHMKRGAIVTYESTVYPGATEEICVPALEKTSGMKWKKDFHVGFSPERINPGDKKHTLTAIVKVVAGAEAAKVIENTQRDLNIALMNELAIIFDKLDIDSLEVLQAAGTKWNFLPFRPGLVGGHCIGVDPYYLTHKAEMIGYSPQVILAGRRINDSMAKFVAEQTIKELIKANCNVKGAKINVLGLTFKENCPDLRNSKVAELIDELKSYGVELHIHDPVADAEEARHEYGVELESWESLPRAEVIIAAVSHQEFIEKSISDFQSKVIEKGCFIDVKSQFDQEALNKIGLNVWRL